MSHAHLLSLCTCPDQPSAERLAEALVAEGLAACVNILPGAISVYTWEGRTERDTELVLLIKTTAARFDELQRRIVALHPYDVPEVIATPISHGLPAYLDWVSACTTN